jgi:hypothetical protein
LFPSNVFAACYQTYLLTHFLWRLFSSGMPVIGNDIIWINLCHWLLHVTVTEHHLVSV